MILLTSSLDMHLSAFDWSSMPFVLDGKSESLIMTVSLVLVYYENKLSRFIITYKRNCINL